jgi:hypothetical protein
MRVDATRTATTSLERCVPRRRMEVLSTVRSRKEAGGSRWSHPEWIGQLAGEEAHSPKDTRTVTTLFDGDGTPP